MLVDCLLVDKLYRLTMVVVDLLTMVIMGFQELVVLEMVKLVLQEVAITTIYEVVTNPQMTKIQDHMLQD